MSNIKKIIGVVLALVMALSVVTVAFAAGDEAYSVAFTVVDNKTTINPGESATVEVRVTANYKVSAMSIPVYFDNTKVTVVATAAENLTGADIVTESSAGAETYFTNSGHTKDDYGLRALVYIAKHGDPISTYDNAVVMTLTVTANQNASGPVTLECLETTIKKTDYPSGTLYVLKNENPDATEVDSKGVVVDAATITNATATINIAGAAQPELVTVNTGAVAVYNGPVEEYKGENLLYGAESGLDEAGLANYFTAKDGKLVWKVGSAQVIGGTGTICELQDNSGNVVATYTLIIFGDIDGNALVGGADSSQVEKAAALDTTALSGYGNIAADIDANALVGGADASQVEKAAALDTTAINQSIGFPVV